MLINRLYAIVLLYNMIIFYSVKMKVSHLTGGDFERNHELLIIVIIIIIIIIIII
jgi:hypothetical protein